MQNLSVAELNDMMVAFRDGCQVRFPATDEAIDGVNFGRFPDDKNLKVNVIYRPKNNMCIVFM